MQEKTVLLAGCPGVFTGVAADDIYFTGFLFDNAEPEFTDVCATILTPGAQVMDIGANIGMKTFILSKILASKSSDGAIWSFEGSPTVAAALQSNIRRNHLENVTAANVAMSDLVGTTEYYDNSAWGGIVYSEKPVEAGEAASNNPPRASTTVTVPMSTLDTIVTNLHLERLDFIKIDTEGHEMHVLRGGAAAIRSFAPFIYLEFNSLALMSNRITPGEFIYYVFENFRHVYYVCRRDGKTSLLPVKQVDKGALVYHNLTTSGFVDDLLLTNREDAPDILKNLLITDKDFTLDPFYEWRKRAEQVLALDRRVFIFGSGNMGTFIWKNLFACKNICAFIDNDPALWGGEVTVDDSTLPIVPLDSIPAGDDSALILIAVGDMFKRHSIVHQCHVRGIESFEFTPGYYAANYTFKRTPKV